jgi:hypothetical protein
MLRIFFHMQYAMGMATFEHGCSAFRSEWQKRFSLEVR